MKKLIRIIKNFFNPPTKDLIVIEKLVAERADRIFRYTCTFLKNGDVDIQTDSYINVKKRIYNYHLFLNNSKVELERQGFKITETKKLLSTLVDKESLNNIIRLNEHYTES